MNTVCVSLLMIMLVIYAGFELYFTLTEDDD